MKKILTVLLVAAMCIVAPSAIFADTNENEFSPEENNVDTSGSVELKADIVSSYTVKLPKVVDVKNTSKTVDIFAKGDVDGSKKIVISESNAGSNVLTDKSGRKQPEALTISFGTGIAGSDILDDYGTAKETMTVTHAALKAGSWDCTLPLLIKLENIAKVD